jgi:DamX protein
VTTTSQLDLGLADVAEKGTDAAARASDLVWGFPVAAHGRLLEQLNEEILSGLAVPLIEGPAKSGKTRLADLFCRNCGPRVGARLLTIALGAGPRSVLRASATALGLSTNDDQSANQLLAILRDFARLLEEKSQTALLVFDDAHNLDARTTAALMSLVHRKGGLSNGLKLLFWSEPGLLNRLDDLQLELSIREFTMPLLTPAETGAFLDQWLQENVDKAIKRGRFPLDASEVQQLWVESGGCIGLVKALACERLEQPEANLKSELKTSNHLLNVNVGGLPVGHVAALLLLIVGLGCVLWLGNSEPRAQAGEADAPAQSATAPDIAAMGRGAGSSGVSAISVQAPVAMSGETRGSAESEAVFTEVEAELEPVVANKELRQALYGTPTQDIPDVSIRNKSQPDSERQPDLVADSPTNRLSTDEQALLAFSPDTFSLQIMSASGRESIEQFKREQPNKSRLYLYQSRRDGQPWFILLAENYPTREAARAAIDSLPEIQRLAGPWPRSLEIVQQEIAENREF